MNALVTGASSGIGRELALQLASENCTVICCARTETALEELSHSTNGQCIALPVDLSEPGASEVVWDYCQQAQLGIDILINCAGFGAVGHHVRHQPDLLGRMCRLNTSLPAELCALFGRDMRRAGRGYILNVSSTAGFMPIPYFANYSASKAFLLSLSESLHEELRPYGVKVCCLCPGPVRTNFHARSNPNYQDDEKSLFSLSAKEVARQGLKALFEGRRRSIPGFANRCSVVLEYLLPRTFVSRLLALKSEGRKLVD